MIVALPGLFSYLFMNKALKSIWTRCLYSGGNVMLREQATARFNDLKH